MIDKVKIINFCDRVIEICFYALLVAVTFSISLTEITSTLMIAAWLVKNIWERDFAFLRSKIYWLLGLFVLWSVLSCFNSQYAYESFRGVFKVLKYAALFIVVSTQMRNKDIARRVISVVMVTTVLVCLDGLIQYMTGSDIIRHRHLIDHDVLRRISASFVHPNSFGGYLMMVCVLILSFLINDPGPLKKRAAYMAVFALSLMCLVLTRSRGAWLSFSVAFFICIFLSKKERYITFFALFSGVFLLFSGEIRNGLEGLLTASKGSTVWERLMLWKGTINMIKEHPFLGFGVNTFSRNFPMYKPEHYTDLRYSHNCYLHMASEIGIIGAVFFLVFVIGAIIYSSGNMGGSRDSVEKSMRIGMVSLLVGFLSNCTVDTHLYSVVFAVLFFALAGYAYSLRPSSVTERPNGKDAR